MPSPVFHVASTVLAYFVLRRYLRGLLFNYFVIATLLPEFDVLAGWVAYLCFGVIPAWGFMHSIFIVITIAFVGGVIAFVLFEKEASPSRLRWIIASLLISLGIHFSQDLVSKQTDYIFAPFSYQPNPFVLIDTFQANVLTALTTSILFSIVLYYYRKGEPIFVLNERFVLAGLAKHLKIPALILQAMKAEFYLLFMLAVIALSAILVMIFPSPTLENMFFAVVFVSSLFCMLLTYHFRS